MAGFAAMLLDKEGWMVDRRNDLIELLRSQKHWTTETLAGQLGVSERTVRRDLHCLRDQGVDVQTQPGRAGGVNLPPGGLLPALRFTDDEALVLAFGLRQAGHLGDPRYLKAAESAFRRLEHVMTERLSERIEALLQTLNVADSPQETACTLNASTMLVLSSAIQHQRRLEVRYRDAGGRVTYRSFDPYGLAQVVGNWYVAGYCHARQGLRTFRVDRLDIVRELTETFTLPADFDALQVITGSIAQAPASTSLTCQVCVQATLEEVSQAFPVVRGTLETQGDGVLITTYTPPEWLAELAVMLLNLGFPLEIVAPVQLREAFSALAARTQAIGRGARA